MNKRIFVTAAIFGILSIILGAFAAHGLKNQLTPEALNSFETGVKYQMYHALFLLFIGTIDVISVKLKSKIYYLTLFGVIFFSFSIYLLSTAPILGVNFKAIGFVTPIGGLLLIVAWSILLIGLLKNKAI